MLICVAPMALWEWLLRLSTLARFDVHLHRLALDARTSQPTAYVVEEDMSRIMVPPTPVCQLGPRGSTLAAGRNGQRWRGRRARIWE
jgi:hypothetical protein